MTRVAPIVTRADRAARWARIRVLVDSGAPAWLIPSRVGGASLLVSRDPYPGQRWRVTWFDAAMVPLGHIDASSATGALATAYDLGGNIDEAKGA